MDNSEEIGNEGGSDLLSKEFSTTSNKLSTEFSTELQNQVRFSTELRVFHKVIHKLNEVFHRVFHSSIHSPHMWKIPILQRSKRNTSRRSWSFPQQFSTSCGNIIYYIQHIDKPIRLCPKIPTISIAEVEKQPKRIISNRERIKAQVQERKKTTRFTKQDTKFTATKGSRGNPLARSLSPPKNSIRSDKRCPSSTESMKPWRADFLRSRLRTSKLDLFCLWCEQKYGKKTCFIPFVRSRSQINSDRILFFTEFVLVSPQIEIANGLRSRSQINSETILKSIRSRSQISCFIFLHRSMMSIDRYLFQPTSSSPLRPLLRSPTPKNIKN